MPENQLYVAPWGRDSWPGTPQRPLASLPAAQRAVRARTATMTADLVVNLRAGTYRLTEPFTLDGEAGDSGGNGYRVIYQSFGHGTARPEEAVLSGGRPVTGWRPVPGGRAWRADVGDLPTRQLYVNGRRAPRATVRPGLPGNVTKTETGFVTDSTLPQTWRDPASIELVFQGVNPWSEARLGVAAISGDERSTTITMAQPGFGRSGELYAARLDGRPSDQWGILAAPTSAENSVSFLTEPGTFALERLDAQRRGGDRAAGQHVLYYLPLPDEDPATAEFVVPVLERLVVGRGTGSRPLHDVTLRGLTLCHAGWTEPSGAGGFLHYHGNAYHDGGPLALVDLAEGLAQLAVPESPAQVPAAVAFTHTQRITLRDNRFTRLGAGAVAFRGAQPEPSSGAGEHPPRGQAGPSEDNAVLGNVIDDVSGGGVAIDSGTRTRVERNLIHDVGREYHGCPAVWVAESREVTVAHNEIHDVPYSGIIVMGGDRAGRVQVVENLVYRTMTVLADGGGIYLAGPQGASYASGTLVRGNVIRDTITPYNFGLYTDFGSAWVTVQGNAVYRADTPAVLRVTPPLDNVAFLGNFWDDEPVGHDTPPPGVTLAGNTVLPRDGFEQALAADPAGADILAGAGRRAG
ncbi:hypothetical protein GCM10023322_49860 [Rugosimonospora acidiphila]|uniref:Right handed beta helix domain-containing protein n=1 Tax=Rugosimonospora acidiphila TaxID=556531 RepID=A0ABP9S792_9ACTN